MTSVIYFVQRSNGDVKIGTTKRLVKRFSVLKSEHGPLKLLGVIKGSYVREKILHWALSDSHIDKEWFSLTPEVKQVIDNYAYVPPIQESLRAYKSNWEIYEVAKLYCVSNSIVKQWLTDGKFPNSYEGGTTFKRTMIRYCDFDDHVKSKIRPPEAIK